MRWLILAALLGGPYHMMVELPPGEVEFFELAAEVKEHKKVEINGDRRSTFICSIFDEHAHTLVMVDNFDDYCLLEFDAKETKFTIMVRNTGTEKDKFSINSN